MTDLHHTLSNLRVHAISFSQGVIFFAKFKRHWKIKIFGGFSDSVFSINYTEWLQVERPGSFKCTVFHWRNTAKCRWGIWYETKGSQPSWKTELGVQNSQYMGRTHGKKKIFLNINTYYISLSLFCFSRNNLLCFLNVIHIYQTAWFLTFRNFFHQNVTEALTKGTNYQGTRFFFLFSPLFDGEAGCRENVNYQLLFILL